MVYNNNLIACIKVDGKVLREKNSSVELPFGTDYIKHGKNPVISGVFAVFSFHFVACLSLKSAK
mgnify:CR=1 FL=1